MLLASSILVTAAEKTPDIAGKIVPPTAEWKAKITALAPAKPRAAPKAPRKTTAATGKQPSAALAAVIGEGAVSRPEVVKKLWDYIKAHGLQDAADKRKVNVDAKLRPVFGKDQVTMFEIAGIVGQHLVD